MSVGPGFEREDDGVEVTASLSEPVLVPVRVGAITNSLKDTVIDQGGQARGEDVAAYA